MFNGDLFPTGYIKMNNLQNHDLISSYKDMRFFSLNIKFKKVYPVAPMVRVWIEAISSDIDPLYFSLPSQNIKHDGFTLLITEYNHEKFNIHYLVSEFKETELERGSV